MILSSRSGRKGLPSLAGLTGLVGLGVLALAATARADDRAVAEAIVARLQADEASAATTAEALAHARDALQRADRLRGVRDEAHARLADGLARDWAEAAEAIVRAAESEARAAAVVQNATDEQTKVERTRALVEEGVARVGRLRAQLDEAEARRHPPGQPTGAGAPPKAARPAALPAPAHRSGK